MTPQIAIPEPTSLDPAYNLRSLAPYLFALKAAGATPIVVPLHERPDRVARVLSAVQGILLPGSRFDVEPERYGQTRSEQCGPADAGRTAVDELLLQDAFNLHKPIFAICHGLQSMNVWCNGTLVQHLETSVVHRAEREVDEAHTVRLVPGTHLWSLLRPNGQAAEVDLSVNSTHHQAIDRVGDHLVVTATSPVDSTVEAVELDSSQQFVLGVQWHPERTYPTSEASRALFAAFVQAATRWVPPLVNERVAAR